MLYIQESGVGSCTPLSAVTGPQAKTPSGFQTRHWKKPVRAVIVDYDAAITDMDKIEEEGSP